MKFKPTFIPVAVLAVAIGSPVYAAQAAQTRGFFTGNDLLTYMRNLDMGPVLGYVGGTADALERQGAICLPVGVTVGQMVTMTRRYMESNPETSHLPGAELVARSLAPYECPKPAPAAAPARRSAEPKR